MQNKTSEIEFFDKFEENKAYNYLSERGLERIFKEYLKFLKQSVNKKIKVLDSGCGTGLLTSRFQKYGFELYGIDISQKAIIYARKKYPNIKFIIGDIENINFEAEHFDVIFLSGVLHHFRDFTKVLKECYRILKKGGIVLGFDPNKDNPFMWLYRCKKSPFYSSKGITENERPLAKKEIYDVLNSTGFSSISVYSVSGVPFNYIDHKLSFIILPIYNLIEKMMDFRPFRKRYGSFIIMYAKK